MDMKWIRRSTVIAMLLVMIAAPGHQVLAQSVPASPSTFPVGSNPSAVALDVATHTAYIVNQGDNTVSVVDVSHCHSGDTSACASVGAIRVDRSPVFAIVNQTTDTVYVTNSGDNTVSVIDGSTCNAAVQTGCNNGRAPTTSVGPNPVFAAIDESTNTIFVLNSNNGDQGSVSIIDGSQCDGTVTSGCAATPRSVQVGTNATSLAFDPANRTVYVADTLDGGPGALSMIDASTCNAAVTSACPTSAPTVPVPQGAGFLGIDPRTDTVYVASVPNNRASLSVINGSRCNARITSSCNLPQPSIRVGSEPVGIVVDQATQSVFVANQGDSTVSVVDGSSCNALNSQGCGGIAPSVAVGFSPGTPDLDAATGTLYVPSENENNVYVLDTRSCTRAQPVGCYSSAPTTTVGTGPQGIAIDRATDTVYVGNRGDNQLSIINAAVCNGANLSGCGTTWPTVATDPRPQAVVVDDLTHTVYTSNNSGTVSVIDISNCNAHDQSGCGQAPQQTVTIGDAPDPLRSLAVDDAVHTLYVTDGNGNNLAMIDTTTCNGVRGSGCGDDLATVSVGIFPQGVVIDQRTQTVYVANWRSATVTVIDAATCNARVTSGCGHTHTIPVGNRPNLMAFNSVTNTLYVTNADDGTVSVIDAATCNAKVSSGCGKTAGTIAVNSSDVAQGTPSPFAIGIDEARDVLYITNIVGSDIMLVDGATCNGKVVTGCNHPLANVSVGGWPTNVVLDPSLDAAYVPQNVDGEVSIIRMLHLRTGAVGLVSAAEGSSSQGSFTVVFDSMLPGRGEVRFGSGPGCFGLVETATQDRGAGTTTHIVKVTGNDLPGTVGDNGIVPGATYWYEAVTLAPSGTVVDNNGGKCYSVTIPTS